MKIYAINDYSNKDIVKKQISFKDMDGDPYISTPKTPYNRAMDNLDKVFCDKLNSLKAKYPDKTAKEYLKSNGYRIIKTNFKNAIGEIDIIAYDGDTLVFVEVKYRKTSQFGLPREAVSYAKQNKIRLVATSYIKKYKLFDKSCRFDVVEVLDKEITIIRDAF